MKRKGVRDTRGVCGLFSIYLHRILMRKTQGREKSKTKLSWGRLEEEMPATASGGESLTWILLHNRTRTLMHGEKIRNLVTSRYEWNTDEAGREKRKSLDPCVRGRKPSWVWTITDFPLSCKKGLLRKLPSQDIGRHHLPSLSLHQDNREDPGLPLGLPPNSLAK